METEAGVPRWYPPGRRCPGAGWNLSVKTQHLGGERRTRRTGETAIQEVWAEHAVLSRAKST